MVASSEAVGCVLGVAVGLRLGQFGAGFEDRGVRAAGVVLEVGKELGEGGFVGQYLHDAPEPGQQPRGQLGCALIERVSAHSAVLDHAGQSGGVGRHAQASSPGRPVGAQVDVLGRPVVRALPQLPCGALTLAFFVAVFLRASTRGRPYRSPA
ncbi:hypothetical protein ABZV67_38040 [Streptomyces sp. NPDC005065]|uniref:hypothetical protein n=1 Tax=Streptomyces sp. NPDC005065 TaxID=3154461 RepID=UPI00339F85F0